MSAHQDTRPYLGSLPQHDEESTSCSMISSDSSQSTLLLPPPEEHAKTTRLLERTDSKGVSFGSVKVREFNRIAGDHPDCTDGPPMSLDWKFIEQTPVTVEWYEGQQLYRRQGLFAVPSDMRTEILLHGFNNSEEDLLAAEKMAFKTARKREKTRKQQQLNLRTRHFIKTTASRWMPSFRSPTYTK